MKTFAALPAEERRLAFQQVDSEMGLQALSIEKDFWVCWTLRELFSLPEVGEHLTFKGGTSLSKAWKLIQRFSEDIDLIVDKEILGFGGDDAPDKAPSNKQRKRRLENLMTAGREWVQGTLQPALTERLRSTLDENTWKLDVDPDMPDGQCLLFRYPSVFTEASAGYVRPIVKIELGGRSDDWPSETRSIQPYVIEHFAAFDSDASFDVCVLKAERTFWEKACLLHEETFRPDGKPRQLRMARHYYDLWCLISAGVADRALTEIELFKRVAEHREMFFRFTWVDYSTHQPGKFRLVPDKNQLTSWRNDYEAMLGPMFFGDTPSFDKIIDTAADFCERFNSMA